MVWIQCIDLNLQHVKKKQTKKQQLHKLAAGLKTAVMEKKNKHADKKTLFCD